MKSSVFSNPQDEIKIDKQVHYFSVLTKVLFLIAISLLVFLITSSTYADATLVNQKQNYEESNVSGSPKLSPPAPY
ncbi:hypothetical protein [Christiangramia portivictoriae]|uniref:hypothetical protein n=1 Tax=Christiangramia portivictoriae TaxID=326069 RepID=UPI00042131D1|nr:hypothetical protein [Christiangramia portivictoriae]